MNFQRFAILFIVLISFSEISKAAPDDRYLPTLHLAREDTYNFKEKRDNSRGNLQISDTERQVPAPFGRMDNKRGFGNGGGTGK
uniref:Uncharacterized protein n=1 Tax=Tityus discrepans TaxID=57059 RepID=C9X4I5_TITDI|nr:hypothetical protein [Tityus discrepans]